MYIEDIPLTRAGGVHKVEDLVAGHIRDYLIQKDSIAKGLVGVTIHGFHRFLRPCGLALKDSYLPCVLVAENKVNEATVAVLPNGDTKPKLSSRCAIDLKDFPLIFQRELPQHMERLDSIHCHGEGLLRLGDLIKEVYFPGSKGVEDSILQFHATSDVSHSLTYHMPEGSMHGSLPLRIEAGELPLTRAGVEVIEVGEA